MVTTDPAWPVLPAPPGWWAIAGIVVAKVDAKSASVAGSTELRRCESIVSVLISQEALRRPEQLLRARSDSRERGSCAGSRRGSDEIGGRRSRPLAEAGGRR